MLREGRAALRAGEPGEALKSPKMKLGRQEAKLRKAKKFSVAAREACDYEQP